MLSDVQAGHEKTITALLPALAGANIIYGMGMTGSGNIFSFTQLLIDHEITRMVKWVVQGIPVSDATLAVDVIKKVGAGKDFIKEKHTRQFMAQEQSKPFLIDGRMREAWQSKAGAKDMAERAREKTIEILETHKPEPLPEHVLHTLRSVVEEAEEEARMVVQ